VNAPVIAGGKPIILASASPRRESLLRWRGYKFEVIPSNTAEEVAETPEQTVTENARRKAHAVARLRPDAVVIGVDTEVFFQGQILGKPADFADAIRMLAALNGKAHEVFSGVCLAWDGGGQERTIIEQSRVHFHRRNDAEMRAYLRRIQPLDKAGAYAAQDDSGTMIARVEGSFSNVMGLPMEKLEQELAELGPSFGWSPA
jgi:septum formation protein